MVIPFIGSKFLGNAKVPFFKLIVRLDFLGQEKTMNNKYQVVARTGFNLGYAIPSPFNSYDLASNWVSQQAPGVQMYLSIVPA